MDDRSFDRLARLLGGASDRRAGLKALAGGILGAGGLAALDMDADAKRRGADRDRGREDAGPEDAKKKRRKRCKPACGAGFACVKGECVCETGVACGDACCALGQSCVEGRCRAASCDPPCANGYVCEGTTCVCPSGIECGAACCAAGQTCRDGACAGQPDPDACIPAGQPCVDAGLACCDGRTCGSGQGGEADVACYVPTAGRCAATADCVFGAECRDGACVPLPTPPPPPTPPTPTPTPPPPNRVDGLGTPCNPATDVCTSPGAACQPYTGAGAPAGAHCTLSRQAACTADTDCACHSCGYAGEVVPGAAGRTTCCGAVGQSCSSERDCCEGTACSGGSCVAAPCTVCKGGGCAHTTVKGAIDAGKTDIRIAGGTYREQSLPAPTSSVPSFTLRACGAGPVTIDARRLGRIMVPIPDGRTVAIRGIVVRNGLATGNGGGFDVQSGGTLALTDATIADCTAAGAGAKGGGIHVDGGTLTMLRVAVTGNTVPTGDGTDPGLDGSAGGGIYLKGNKASSLTDCVIDDNYSYGSGGGVWLDMAANLTISGGSISGNEAFYRGGGGAYLKPGAGKAITLRDVVVSGNTTTRGTTLGVGVWSAGDSAGSVGFAGATRIENNVSTASGSRGGGLCMENGSVTLGPETVVSGNSVTGSGGGVSVEYGTLTVEGTIRNNVTGGSGGGIYNSWFTILAGNAKVRENEATGEGGGIYNEWNLTVGGGTRIEGNTASAGAGIFAANYGSTAVACPSSTARVCGNPASGATGATNCGGTASKYATSGANDCTAVCVGGGPGGTDSGDACPA